MKRTSIYYFSLAALAIGSLASCQEADLGFDEEAIREATVLKEYQKNFEARYGKIDPNHDWGFKDIVITNGVDVSQGTRGAADDLWDPTVPSQQHWFEYYGLTPPGAPDDWNTNSPYGQIWAGSVTAEEILFVSEFFRVYNKDAFDSNTFTTNKPNGLVSAEITSLHLTDFFVESISGDDDQSSYNTNSHGEGTPIYTQAGVSAPITYGMDCLIARTMDSSDDYRTWHHVNNFNYSSTVHRPQQYADNSVNPFLPKDADGFAALNLKNPTDSDVDDDSYRTEYSLDKNRTLMYVRSSGTESFAFHPSWDDQSSFYESYVLVHLSFNVNGHHYDGTYLAFDWQGKNASQHAAPDGFYNNWIIKVTPAHFVPSQKFPVSRIMCEDLGNTLDFDFNDMVFDVKYEAEYTDGIPTKLTAVLTVQASGGTLPIYLGKQNANYETHFLLGNATNVPVNVGGVSHAPAIIRLELNTPEDWTYTGAAHNTQIVVNPNNIPIYVGSNSASLVSASKLLPAAGGTAGQSAPQKISIPYTDTKWLKESQQIEWGYGYFDEWVKDENKYGYYIEQNGQKQLNPDAWTQKHKTESTGPNGGLETDYLY